METLIILHGWQSSKERWAVVKEKIETEGCEVIVPDLPGFKKENELKRVWNLNDYVKWTKEFIERVCSERLKRGEKIFLLGHSFGGRIAIKFAVRYPELITGLILCDAAGVSPRPKLRVAFFAFLSQIGNLIFSLPVLKYLRPLAKRFIYFLIGTRDYRFIQGPLMKETFQRVIGEDLTSLLSQIKVPTLIIWGDRDRMTPLRDAYLMKKEIPDSKLEVLEGFSHVPHLENPKLLSCKIVNFIKETNETNKHDAV